MPEISSEIEHYRPELRAYCYRMLASPFDADDAVQETMIRAWKYAAQFDGRSSLKAWLYRIATNVCIDELKGRKRRIHPTEEGLPGGGAANGEPLPTRPPEYWVEPILDADIVDPSADPGQQVLQRESIRLAFVVSLQTLPPKQRAALLMADVLDFSSAEIADALGSSVPSINSALQRARATLKSRGSASIEAVDASKANLLSRYMEAFERFDVSALTSLMREDVAFCMPPFALWLQGSEQVATFMQGSGSGCRNSRTVAHWTNGSPAFAQYRRTQEAGYRAWALVVLDSDGERVTGITNFLDVERLFPRFGLPLEFFSTKLPGRSMNLSQRASHSG